MTTEPKKLFILNPAVRKAVDKMNEKEMKTEPQFVDELKEEIEYCRNHMDDEIVTIKDKNYYSKLVPYYLIKEIIKSQKNHQAKRDKWILENLNIIPTEMRKIEDITNYDETKDFSDSQVRKEMELFLIKKFKKLKQNSA